MQLLGRHSRTQGSLNCNDRRFSSSEQGNNNEDNTTTTVPNNTLRKTGLWQMLAWRKATKHMLPHTAAACDAAANALVTYTAETCRAAIQDEMNTLQRCRPCRICKDCHCWAKDRCGSNMGCRKPPLYPWALQTGTLQQQQQPRQQRHHALRKRVPPIVVVAGVGSNPGEIEPQSCSSRKHTHTDT
jgi:hypothetical protein